MVLVIALPSYSPRYSRSIFKTGASPVSDVGLGCVSVCKVVDAIEMSYLFRTRDHNVVDEHNEEKKAFEETIIGASGRRWLGAKTL